MRRWRCTGERGDGVGVRHHPTINSLAPRPKKDKKKERRMSPPPAYGRLPHVYVIYFVTLSLLSHRTAPRREPRPYPSRTCTDLLRQALLAYRHTSATKRRGAWGPKSSVRRRGCTPLRRVCVPQHRCARGSIAARPKKCYQRAWRKGAYSWPRAARSSPTRRASRGIKRRPRPRNFDQGSRAAERAAASRR